ncbi:SNF2 family N-terminal domain-containing protein [Halteromyces radiatus]|uniref:SNF2 family N-terminal domain-containing protein n=1 Tax=Halteromyces radiatus TaxID=101107 RepID=UPI00221EB787|nr:SNF2 family N-terminal domain-containing protein [Halteromyces radiatus]KAI8097070.1 SNF2 family N-terminal domain-containing protein [Halteromyces radiatus]
MSVEDLESQTQQETSLTPSVMATDQESQAAGTEDNNEVVVTSTMLKEEEDMAKETKKEHEARMQKEAQVQFDSTVKEQRMKRLNFLLEKSGAYASILGQRLAKQQEEAREKAAKLDAAAAATTTNDGADMDSQVKSKKGTRKSSGKNAASGTKRRKTNDAQYQLEEYLDEQDLKRRKNNESVASAIKEDARQGEDSSLLVKPTISARQPSLVTGGVLRDYQLAGVEWLISLWENGLNGILADEMGLGKTLQTISFIAHLKAMQVAGPYLIVTPLSTLANWVNEFKRFTPDIPVILYHGSKDERQHLINRKMAKKNQTNFDFPIVVTSYEIVMNDRKHLQKYNWKYIVVDEGHRLKNMNCKLIRELKTYSSANRLLLTGTPLQNNLAELWSLLNFLLPDIFDSLDMFESWFDFSDIHQKSGQERIMKEEQEDQIITSLHTILKPFLLRRLKTDVEHSLPKKKEYLLYAPLTVAQKNLYDAIIKRDLRDYLIKRKTTKDDQDNNDTKEPETADVENQENANTDGNNNTSTTRKSSRALKSVTYKDPSDRTYFATLEKQAQNANSITEDANLEVGKKHQYQNAIKHVNSLHLQNLVMQLRKVCNHPFLFDWPIDPRTNTHVLNNDLAAQSGKVLLLDRLLTALFDRGHKVLIFSQMTKMLDILEDWATHLKGWPICRLDGSVSQESRRQQIEEFNDPDSPFKLFLLSTRAGGLGINLTGADTVIIFDSDWNPQMDLQAQDRVHRIGQTKPVLVYRFVAANTVEAKILERATAKRRLEKLVISKGKFKTPISSTSGSAKKEQENSVRELAEILASEDGEQVQIVAQGDKVISDEDLDKILDRSDQVLDSQNISVSGGFKQLDASEMIDAKNEILATRT